MSEKIAPFLTVSLITSDPTVLDPLAVRVASTKVYPIL